MTEQTSQTLRHIIELPKESPDSFKDWIPVIQSAIWPAVLLIVLFAYRRHLFSLFYSIAERVRRGDPWKVGPVEMGAGQQKMDGTERPRELAAKGADKLVPPELPNTIYMSHSAIRDPLLDRHGRQYYRLSIYLDADSPELLDEVERVLYHLHPSFKNPDRTATDRDSRFEIRTTAWGEFNMTADVFFKGRNAPLNIERYINFLWAS